MRIGSTPITDIKIGSTQITKVIRNGITYWQVTTTTIAPTTTVAPTTTTAGQAYYVKNGGDDSKSGLDDANAWATIATVNSRTFNPDDQVLFKCNDVWRETLILPSSGSAAHYITFSSYGTGAKPQILGSEQAVTWEDQGGNIWKSATSVTNPYATSSTEAEIFYIELDGSIKWGVYKTDTANLTAEYHWTWLANYIYIYAATDPDVRYTSVEVPQRDVTIEVGLKEYITIDSLQIQFTKSKSIEATVSTDPTVDISGLTIKNCYMSHVGSRFDRPAGVGSRGYHLAVCRNIFLAKDNEISEGGRRNVSFHLYSPTSNRLGQTISNIVFDGNILHDGYHSSGVGIVADPSSAEYNYHFANIIVKNNLTYDSPDRSPSDGFATNEMGTFKGSKTGCSIHDIKIYNNVWKNVSQTGIWLDQADNVEIYNNTFYEHNHNYGTGVNMYQIQLTLACHNISIKNNIFYSTVDWAFNEGAHNIRLQSTIDVSEVTLDYNLYYQSSAQMGIIVVGPTYYRTNTPFSNITGALGWEVHGQVIDPLFTSTSIYTLQASSPAVGTGVDVSGYITDYSGVNVSSPPNIGAFETTTPDILVYISSVIANATPTLLEMTFSLSLANIVPATSAFTVLVNSIARTVNTVSISTTKVILTLASDVVYGDVVTVAYTKPVSNPLQTLTGGEAESISTQSVINNISSFTKTWSTWDNSVVGENLVDVGTTSRVFYAKDNTDVAAKFTFSGTSGDLDEYAYQTTGDTWEAWGVPAGKQVTNVQVMGWKKKLVNNTSLVSVSITMYIYGSDNLSALNATLLPAVVLSTNTDGSYVDQSAGIEIAVNSTRKASNTIVKFVLRIDINGATGDDLRIDDVALKITFV